MNIKSKIKILIFFLFLFCTQIGAKEAKIIIEKVNFDCDSILVEIKANSTETIQYILLTDTIMIVDVSNLNKDLFYSLSFEVEKYGFYNLCIDSVSLNKELNLGELFFLERSTCGDKTYVPNKNDTVRDFNDKIIQTGKFKKIKYKSGKFYQPYGKHESYFETGVSVSQKRFYYDDFYSLVINYYKTGKIKSIGEKISGCKTGVWFFYDESMKNVFSITYDKYSSIRMTLNNYILFKDNYKNFNVNF